MICIFFPHLGHEKIDGKLAAADQLFIVMK